MVQLAPEGRLVKLALGELEAAIVCVTVEMLSWRRFGFAFGAVE
jgi:hypothetical protein